MTMRPTVRARPPLASPAVLVLAALLGGAPLGAQAAAQRASLAPAIQLFESGRTAEAKPLFAAVVARDPRDAEAHFYLGRIAMRASSLGEAIAEFERAVALDPRRSRYHEWLGNAYGSQARGANTLKQAGLARKMIGAWNRAVELDPDNIDARESRVQFYLQAPGIMGGSTDKALAEVAEIRRRNPYRGTLAAAAVQEHEKQYAAAERTYTDAIRAFPDSMGLRYRLGLGYQALKEWDKAFAVWDEMLRLRPAEAGALYQVGRTGALSGQQLDRAEQALRRYLAAQGRRPTDPPPAAAHYRLGMVLERKGDRVAARAEYEAALQADPQHKDAKAALAKLR
jgi:tetratricopeptide (TPR) repeat protein